MQYCRPVRVGPWRILATMRDPPAAATAPSASTTAPTASPTAAYPATVSGTAAAAAARTRV